MNTYIPRQYRKRPVVITAVQYGGSTTDIVAIRRWIEGGEYVRSGVSTRDMRPMEIETLEGTMIAQPADWIIRGVNGEHYPCKPDIFAKTYEQVESEGAE